MDDGEEEMGFGAFPCIISTGFFFDFFSGLVPIFLGWATCTVFVLGWPKNTEKLTLSYYLTISVTRLGLLPGSSQFHNSIKLEERNASSSKCLLKLLLFVHGVMSVSLNFLRSFLPFLSETAGPTNQGDRKPHMFRCSDSERYFVKDISLWFSFWASKMEGRSGYSVLCLLAGISMTEELLRVIVTSVTMSLLRLEPLHRASLLCGFMGSVLCKVNI